MQTISADEFLGKRCQVRGCDTVRGPDQWAGLWMRVDGPDSGRHLAFDNMLDRPIKGTTDWTRYAVVLDVDKTAVAIAFGVLAGERGSCGCPTSASRRWQRMKPVTGAAMRTRPENLDFSSSDG